MLKDEGESWRRGSVGRVLALYAQGPEFCPLYCGPTTWEHQKFTILTTQ